jgi:hypothetical protein
VHLADGGSNLPAVVHTFDVHVEQFSRACSTHTLSFVKTPGAGSQSLERLAGPQSLVRAAEKCGGGHELVEEVGCQPFGTWVRDQRCLDRRLH